MTWRVLIESTSEPAVNDAALDDWLVTLLDEFLADERLLDASLSTRSRGDRVAVTLRANLDAATPEKATTYVRNKFEATTGLPGKSVSTEKVAWD